MRTMNIKLPSGVSYIIRELNRNRHEAYVVGGSIRDALIGLVPKDYDITTSANPEEVMRIFKKTIPTGIQHGTVQVITSDGMYDVTTYRSEGDYRDNRYPTNVIFIDDLVEDLKRRDITINAMAYNTEKGIIDPFNGTEDIKGRIIKAVGNPTERFKEDALRILRAVRLATVLDFNIEENTLQAIVETMDGLRFISVERIREELDNILLSDNPSRGISLLYHLGLMKYVLPELMPIAIFNQFNPYHDKDVLNHTLEVLENTPKNLAIRLAALLHDSGKPSTFTVDEKGIGHFYDHEKISAQISKLALSRLKYDNKTVNTVNKLISFHMVSLETKNELKLKKLINNLGKENISALIDLKTADFIAKPDSGSSKLYEVAEFRDRVLQIIERKDPLSVKDLAIDGNDILNLGVKEGRLIGKVLSELLELVLKNPELNKSDILLNIVKKELIHDN